MFRCEPRLLLPGRLGFCTQEDQTFVFVYIERASVGVGSIPF